MFAEDPTELDLRVGLCAVCRHSQRIRSHRGSVYYLCGLSAVDKKFPKYPPLPVRNCPGYEDIPEGTLTDDLVED